MTIPAAPLTLRPQFEIYWGHRLLEIDRNRRGGTLQEQGVHFQFVLVVF